MREATVCRDPLNKAAYVCASGLDVLHVQAAQQPASCLACLGHVWKSHHVQYLSYRALQAVTDSPGRLADALLAKGKDRKPGAGGTGAAGHAHGQVRHALFCM